LGATATRGSEGAGEEAIEPLDGAAGDEDRVRTAACMIESAPTARVDERQRGCVDDDDLAVEQAGGLHRIDDRRARARVQLAADIDDDDSARPGHPNLE
jgi:hypothetical protein